MKGVAAAKTQSLAALLSDGVFVDGDWIETKDQDPNGDVRLIQLADIGDGMFRNRSSRYLTSTKAQELKCTFLEPGDILIARMPEPLGRACVFPGVDQPAVTAVDICILRPNASRVLSEWLVRAINAPTFRAAMQPFVRGTTRQRISRKNLGSMELSVPALSTQAAAIWKLDQAEAALDSAVSHVGQAAQSVMGLRQAVLSAACSGRLTEAWREHYVSEPLEATLQRIEVQSSRTGRSATDNTIAGDYVLSVGDPGSDAPPGWQWVSLTQIARLESGHTPSRKHPEYWGGDVPWIGIQDAREAHGTAIANTRQHTNEQGLANSSARLLPTGTVCLSRTASVGYAVIMGRPMATSQDFVNWVCSEALLPEFLLLAIMAEGSGIRRFGRGTTHTTIYFPEIKALHICLPPVAEQRKICDIAADLMGRADQLDHEVDTSQRLVSDIRASVLARGLRGELVA